MAAASSGIRTRTFDFPPSGKAGTQTSPQNGDNRVWKFKVSGEQRTFSQENLWTERNQLLSDRNITKELADSIRRQDYGGDFETYRHEYWGSHPGVTLSRPWIGGTYRYSGPLSAVPLDNVGPRSTYWPQVPSDMVSSMIQKGTTAIARTVPTNPAVGVGQFLGELRQGLPSVPGKDLYQALNQVPPNARRLTRFNRAGRGASSEYLNYEFGIRPIISDTREFVKAAVNSDKIVKQLARDSGRLIRRRYSFPEERSISLMNTKTGAYPWPDFFIGMTDKPGTYTWHREIITRTWFSGAYTYHYEQGRRLWDRIGQAEQEANRLFGLRLSPALAWELAPWSWLVDWKTNLGDVMTNISAFSRDGLVLAWGYVMSEMIITDTHTVSGGTFYRTDQATTGAISSVFKTHVKKRVKATPYGFGLDPNWNDFSSRQLAILGALGITRASR